MTRRIFSILMFVLLLLIHFTVKTGEAKAETLIGSNHDSRVILALSVDPSAAGTLLPDGWSLTSFPGGPLEGANMLMVFIDRHLGKDADGNLSSPPILRGLALVSPATASGSDQMRIFVTRIFTTAEGNDPYKNSTLAQITRAASLTSSGNEAATRTENWTVAHGGGDLTLSLEYAGGNPAFSTGEARPYSNVDPEFYRIYRYQQLADLAMSVPLGKKLSGEMSLASSIPELAGLLNGQEDIIAAIVLPVYMRETFLP